MRPHRPWVTVQNVLPASSAEPARGRPGRRQDDGQREQPDEHREQQLPQQLDGRETLDRLPDGLASPDAEQDDEHPAHDADEAEGGHEQERDDGESPDDHVGGRALRPDRLFFVVGREVVGIDPAVAAPRVTFLVVVDGTP